MNAKVYPTDDWKGDKEKFFKKYVKNQNLPRNDALKQIIFEKIMENFEKSKKFEEKEVNQIINKFYSDHCLIRRELVNFGYMKRNPLKGTYFVVKKKLTKEDFLRIERLKRHAKDIGMI